MAWTVLCLLASLVGAPVFAATQMLAPSDDTFINSANPNNNNGGSASIYTGKSGQGGLMRGLIRFGMPTSLAGRVTVSNVQLNLTTRAVGSGAPGTAATDSLFAITQAWVQGNGVGNAQTLFTVGQACTVGATWIQASSPGTNWTPLGGAVVGASSASASVPAATGALVTWSAPGMSADVQGWIDTPATNHGWRISSSTEVVSGQAQRFYSSESGTSVPSLAITYNCKAGFLAIGNGCTTCTATANSNCAVPQGNACVDTGPPSTTYTCTCSNSAYVGTGSAACIPLSSCTYSLSPLDLSNMLAAGGSPSITVTTPSGCPVTATSFQPWVTVNSITPNGGTTTVALTISANAGAARATAIVVADRLFLITQLGP